MIDCYRDPSVLQFVAVNASDAWHNLRRGKLIAAAKNVFDSPEPHLAESRVGRAQVDQRRVGEAWLAAAAALSP